MRFKSLLHFVDTTQYVLNKQNLLRPTKKSIWVTYLHTLPISIAQTSLIYKYPILLESVHHQYNFLMKPSSKKKTPSTEKYRYFRLCAAVFSPSSLFGLILTGDRIHQYQLYTVQGCYIHSNPKYINSFSFESSTTWRKWGFSWFLFWVIQKIRFRVMIHHYLYCCSLTHDLGP